MARRAEDAGERAGKVRTMQTMPIPRFGGPDVLTVIEKQVRPSRPGRVSLDVAYAGVNYLAPGVQFGEAIGKPT